MNKLVLIFLCMLMVYSLHAQMIEIDWIEMSRDKVIVHYKLDDSNPNHQYQVNLFSSKDNFLAPLTKVAGDVGSEVKPGNEKKIEWSIVQELAGYKGDLALEIRAKVYLPFVKVTQFDTHKTYKRGKTHPLTWTSGNMGGTIDIELFDGKDRKKREPNVPNTGKYEWAIPSDVKPGSNYRLRFTDTRNREDYVETGVFKIAAKVPTLVKIAGAALLVGGGVVLLNALKDEPTGSGDNPLPSQPGMPTNN